MSSLGNIEMSASFHDVPAAVERAAHAAARAARERWRGMRPLSSYTTYYNAQSVPAL